MTLTDHKQMHPSPHLLLQPTPTTAYKQDDWFEEGSHMLTVLQGCKSKNMHREDM